MKERVFLSSFVIKIIALVTMIIDHLAVFLDASAVISISYPLYFTMRIIGRIAFPLYLFCIYEGMKHTHNKLKYISRLAIMAGIIYLVIAFINFPFLNIGINSSIFIMNVGNVFVDLTLSALFMYLIEHKNKYLRYLSVLPLLYLIGCGFLKYFRINTIEPGTYHFLYDGLLSQFDFITVLLIVLFYFGVIIFNKSCFKIFDNDEELFNEFKKTNNYRFRINAIISISIVLVSVICYLVGRFSNIPLLSTYMDYEIESYIVLAIFFVLWYNGKLGLSNKIVKYGFYLSYPLHLLILFLIFSLI